MRAATPQSQAARLRVLHVLLHGGIGGIEAYVRDLARAQQKTGLEVGVVCCLQGGVTAEALEGGGVSTFVCGCETGHDLRLVPRLARVIQSFEPDILNFHALPALASFPAWLYGTASVFTVHLTGLDFRTRTVMQLFSRVVQGAIAVSDDVLRQMQAARQFSKAHWAVIPPGVDLARFTQKEPGAACGGTFRMAVVGRLEPDKCFDEAIRTAALLQGSGLPVQLEVAGSGSEEGALRALAVSLGIGEQVRFVGPLSRIEDLLHRSDVLLLTSVAETFGIAALEAMACGVPVAAYPVAGGINSWLTPEAGATRSAHRAPAELAEAVRRLAQEPAYYATCARRGRETAVQYSCERLAAQTLDLYAACSVRAARFARSRSAAEVMA